MIYFFFIFFFINLILIYLFNKIFKTNIIRRIISFIILSRLIFFSCIIFQLLEFISSFSLIFILEIFCVLIENLIIFIIRLYAITNSLVYLPSLILVAKFKSQILFFENPNTSSCPSFFNISKCLFKIMVFLHFIVCFKLSTQIKNSFLVMISELF